MSYTEPSPFTCLEAAFASLSAEPRRQTFDGSTVDGLPDRAIPMPELRERMLHPSTDFAIRNAVIGTLVADAKDEGGAATIALAGMLLPGLRRAAYPLVRACPDRAADVEADMLAGLLAALDAVSPTRPRLAGYLVGMAFTAAKRGVRKELAERGRVTHEPKASVPQPPFGHPDFLLWEAAFDGVISADDAELIGTTRFEGVNLKRAARLRGIDVETAQKRRKRAEQRVLRYVQDGSVWPLPHLRRAIPRS
jgi:DNA-directed RNA polymerase specialized sigma24 family protein